MSSVSDFSTECLESRILTTGLRCRFAHARSLSILLLASCLALHGATAACAWSTADDPGINIRPSSTRPEAKPEFIPGRLIVKELEAIGQFVPVKSIYGGRLGAAYKNAMATVSAPQHYTRVGSHSKWLDPTTEAHESLHQMSSLIRRTRGREIGDGYDVIYVGDGQFAEIRLSPGITKGKVAGWVPPEARSSQVVKVHTTGRDFRDSHAVLIFEELAYHLLDAKIGLENHQYLSEKLGMKTAVTAAAADWTVLALAAATMLDGSANSFPSQTDRLAFEHLLRRLIEQAVNAYARGMDVSQYGILANLSPEVRSEFVFLATDESPQAQRIRAFCAKTYGRAWLPGLASRVERARDFTEFQLDLPLNNPRR